MLYRLAIQDVIHVQAVCVRDLADCEDVWAAEVAVATLAAITVVAVQLVTTVAAMVATEAELLATVADATVAVWLVA
ncbi:MAG: hypothetical protein KF851_06925 [Pirellulaceae bacterium]|nr:hypothetical protein [Pirellulaceae bacterium]